MPNSPRKAPAPQVTQRLIAEKTGKTVALETVTAKFEEMYKRVRDTETFVPHVAMLEAAARQIPMGVVPAHARKHPSGLQTSETPSHFAWASRALVRATSRSHWASAVRAPFHDRISQGCSRQDPPRKAV